MKNSILLCYSAVLFICIFLIAPPAARAVGTCFIIVESEPNPANIGSFRNGYSGSDIPGQGGETNFIEFTIYYDYNYDVTINLDFHNTPENNHVNIDAWTWDFMDRDSPEVWYDRRVTMPHVMKVMKLVQNLKDKCQSWGKARIMLNHITVAPDASAGDASCVVLITATSN